MLIVATGNLKPQQRQIEGKLHHYDFADAGAHELIMRFNDVVDHTVAGYLFINVHVFFLLAQLL